MRYERHGGVFPLLQGDYLLDDVISVTAYPLERRSTYFSVTTLLKADELVIATTVRWARTPMARLRGLLGGPPLDDAEGLILVGARQVHTVGLPYSLDVAFCDREWRVVHIERGMGPRRVSPWVSGSRLAIEGRAGFLEGVEVGALITLRDP